MCIYIYIYIDIHTSTEHMCMYICTDFLLHGGSFSGQECLGLPDILEQHVGLRGALASAY